jgi:hypothetical protein
MTNLCDVAVHPTQCEVRELLRTHAGICGIVDQLRQNGLTPRIVEGCERDLAAALAAIGRYASTGDAREREIAELHLQAAVSF